MAQTEPMSELVEDLMRAASAARQRTIRSDATKCATLAAGENLCLNGKHFWLTERGEGALPEERMIRDCPLAFRKAQAERRQQILDSAPHVAKIAARYGLHDWSDDQAMWVQLLARVDAARPVRCAIGQGAAKWQPLAHLVDLIRRGCHSPAADGPNVMFFGPCGTGKTTLQAVRFLAYAEAGIDAAFLDSIDMRKIVADLNSRYSETAAKAHQDLERLVNRAVLFWSDVGDTQATRREFAETIAAFLERFGGKLETSTNLTLSQLGEHPDIGRRALSRMLASRGGKPSLYVTLDGPDQRQHGADQGQEVLAL